MEYLATVGPNLIMRTPMLVAWLVGIVISVRMLKKRGGKAERLLLIGCSLMFAENLIRPFEEAFISWYIAGHGPGLERLALIHALAALPLSLVSLAGIVCLVVAFWTRWKGRGDNTIRAGEP
jgi:hypothetical protein